MNTFLDAKKTIAKFVGGGKCYDNENVALRVNEVHERLMDIADWSYTTKQIRFYVNNNSIAMPYNVERVINVDIDGVPSMVHNRAYEFLEGGVGDINTNGRYAGKDLVDLGEGWPTFYEMPDYLPLLVYSTSSGEGSITVKGHDDTGLEVSEEIPIQQFSGAVDGHIVGTPITSTKSFRDITYVKKPTTTGYVTLMSYDSETPEIYFLSKYAPNEQYPGYKRYRVAGACIDNSGNDTAYNNILCQCKMKHVNMIDDDEVLIIQNLAAIKQMAIAIREEEANRFDNAARYEAKAIQLLDRQLGNVQAKQTIVQVKPAHGFKNSFIM